MVIKVMEDLSHYVCHCSPSAFVERVFHCSWTTFEEKCMDGVAAVSSGFHRMMNHLKMIMAKLETQSFQHSFTSLSPRYLHEDEIGIPGSLRNMKQKFHHKHAGREAKVASSS